MRIAQMIGSMREGGAEGQVVELTRGLRDRGHQVTVLLLRAEGPRMPALRELGVPVYDVALPRLRPFWNPLGWLGAIVALLKTAAYLRRWKPDVLHTWLFEADAWGTLCRFLGVRAVHVQARQIVGGYKDRRPWIQPVHDICNRFSRAIIPNSKEVARDFLRRERRFGNRVVVVYNGLDLSRWATATPLDLGTAFPGTRGASHVAVCVANLLSYKGHADLIEAWKLVTARFPDAHVLFVGKDDGMGPGLRRQAAGAGLADRVHLVGSRTDVPEILRACTLFVIASHEEGLSNVVLEAMGAGIPVVSTRAGGNAEAFVDGVSGIAVTPRRPAELAAALLSLLESPGKTREMGRSGQDHVRRVFSLARLVHGHEAVFENALREQRGGAE